MMLTQHSVNSDWLFNTQSRVQHADWFILEINEKETSNISMPYYSKQAGRKLSLELSPFV